MGEAMATLMGSAKVNVALWARWDCDVEQHLFK
jgi:hypothetical protein